MRRKLKILASVAVAGAMLAACSSSSDEEAADTTAAAVDAVTTETAVVDSTPADTSAADTTEAAAVETTESDGTPIVIGGVGTLTGFAGVDDGVKARLERANAEGGVAGHPIEYLGTTDDGGDAAKNDAAVRELIQQKKVDAVVPVVPTNLQASTAQFMLEENIPYVGMGFGAGMCQNDAGFAFNGCNVPGIDSSTKDALVQWVPKAVGKEDLAGVKVAVLSSDAPTGEAFRGAVSDALEKLGAEIVLSQGGVPAGATNVQTYVDAILSSGAELSVIVTDFVGMLSLQGTLKANGYTGAMVNFAGFIPGILESSKDLQGALEGSYIGTVIPTPFDGTPAGDQMKADFDAVGAAPTFGALLGYSATDLYLQLLEAAGGDPTKVVEAGNDDFTFLQAEGGFSTEFPAGHTTSATCSGMVTVKDGAYSLVAPFSCLD